MFEKNKLGLIHTPHERLITVPHILNFTANGPGSLPYAPDATDYSQSLPDGLWGIDGNGPDPTNPDVGDGCGDCVLVALANGIRTQAVNAGQPVPQWTSQDIVGWYKANTNPPYDPNDPNTDTGTDPLSVLKWAVNQNLILAFGQVSISDTPLSVATNLFGGVLVAVNVPAAWMSSDVWDKSNTRIVGGHGIWLPSYDQKSTRKVETWGQIVTMTPAGWAQNGVAAYAFVTNEMMESDQESLQGFNMASLTAQLQNVQ